MSNLSTTYLSVIDLCKHFGAFQALKNISIEIDNLFPIIRKHLSYKNSKGDYIKWVLNFKQDKNILFVS